MVTSFNLLYSYIPHQECRDQLTWQLKGRGDFDMRSFYDALRGLVLKVSLGKVLVCQVPKKGFFLCLDGSMGEDPYM